MEYVQLSLANTTRLLAQAAKRDGEPFDARTELDISGCTANTTVSFVYGKRLAGLFVFKEFTWRIPYFLAIV